VDYLLLLGWSRDDRTEIFDRREMIRVFSLDRVNRAAASFDPAKLNAFQERYMLALPVQQRVEMTLPYLQKAGLVDESSSATAAATLAHVIEAAGDRIKVAGDVLDYDAFFVADDALRYDEKAFDKRLRKPADAAELLRAFRDRLSRIETFEAVALEAAMRELAEEREIGMGRVIHPVRVAVTGKAVGFGMFETLEILGRERCLRRIDIALERI
jgi:glutamyl-tRNA synthetase